MKKKSNITLLILGLLLLSVPVSGFICLKTAVKKSNSVNVGGLVISEKTSAKDSTRVSLSIGVDSDSGQVVVVKKKIEKQ